jgi:hypothetical protein
VAEVNEATEVTFPVMYTGPNLRKVGLSTHTRFTDGFPEHVKIALQRNPSLRRYFVDWDQFWRSPTPPGASPKPVPSSLPPANKKQAALARREVARRSPTISSTFTTQV